MKNMLIDAPDIVELAASQPACAGQHFGPWAIEEQWFSQAVAAVNAGRWPMRPVALDVPDSVNGEPVLFALTADGIAVVSIKGQMQKGDSSFGGASTTRTRRALREATGNDAVKGIMLLVDSPGGTVAGTMELADDVFAIRGQKPIHAFIEDKGASAAFWVVSQATRVSANPVAMVGSIGTLLIIEDLSGLAEQKGIKVHVIASGKDKGAFAPGTKVTDEQLALAQEMVDDINTHFLAAVSRGRGVGLSEVKGWATGRVWIGQKAVNLGLIDAVETFDAAIGSLRAEVASNAGSNSRHRTAAEYDLRIAERI